MPSSNAPAPGLTGLVYAAGTPEAEDVSVMRANFKGKPGALIDYWQGGGGGWGNPLERDVDRERERPGGCGLRGA